MYLKSDLEILMALQSKQERAEPLVCWEGFGFELISCIDT